MKRHHRHPHHLHSCSDVAVPSSSSPSPSPSDQSLNVLASSSVVSQSSSSSLSATQPLSFFDKPMVAAEDLSFSRDPTSSAETVSVERRGNYGAICKWAIANFPKSKARALWSKYFEVGGYDCRLLIYPRGDSQALPGYISIYLQIIDPRNTTSSKWDCFASYRLSVEHPSDTSKSISRDSWHRFSSKKKSHGWCDFTPLNSILDPKLGFLYNNETLLVTADILILHESVSFNRDNNEVQTNPASSLVGAAGNGDVLSGKFTWKIHNFSLFKEMIKTQKIMSHVFPAGECNLRISVYQSSVNGIEYLSMCLESKDTEKSLGVSDKSCWCLFRMSILNQKPGLNHMHRDSYGRFAADNKSGDNTSLGWNDYMKMADFVGAESGYLVDDTAIFISSFHVIKEFNTFSKSVGFVGGRIGNGGARKVDGNSGKFIWKIENFSRMKDLLKKRKITGLCIKSRRFQIGNRDCRLIVYPRGQSQPPCHLSVFLEVIDSRNTNNDWSCFVSHRLSVVNQKLEEKSVTKESQNRYSKAAKDWGWREFVTLTSLFDQDSGFLEKDTVSFFAEVLILKETSLVQDFTIQDFESESSRTVPDIVGKRNSFAWKVENFLSFKEIIETRKIFSKFFQAGGCELRIGVYESFDTICIYLESDQSACSDPEKNFWVKYRMAIVNQKNSSKTVWKESSICTKTWNNSVLQFMKVSDMLEPESGFLMRDAIIFVCEILDCCPWFDFADLEVLASEDDPDALTTDPDELIDSEDSDGVSEEEDDIFRNLLSRAGFHLTCGDNTTQPQVALREKLLTDAGTIAGFLNGLRVYLDDPAKVKRLLLPTKLSDSDDGRKLNKNNESSPSLMNMLMGVKVLQQAIVDLLLDIMVECCQPLEGNTSDDYSETSSKPSLQDSGATTPEESERGIGSMESAQLSLRDRVDMETSVHIKSSVSASAQRNGTLENLETGEPTCFLETLASVSHESLPLRSKTKQSEQSKELLGMIVSSLKALDGAVPHGCPEPRRRPQSAQKIALVLDNAPRDLQPEIVSLVPKLVERSEHPIAASSLLDRLQKPDAESSLRIPVFGALGQLECSSEVWERVLSQSFGLLDDSNDEPLAATFDFVFKAALHCQHLPEAVRSVRVRLKSLGAEVSQCVLDYLSRTVNSFADIAEAFIRDIDCDDDFGDSCAAVPREIFVFGDSGTSEKLPVNEQAFRASYFSSDIYMLIEMLSIPCLAVEASKAFERAVARRAIVVQYMAVVLERRLARGLNSASQIVADNSQHTESKAQQDDFSSVLGLADTLSLSKNPHVRGFVKLLYTILFKLYTDESYRLRMLKSLVDRATSTSESTHEVDFDFEILVILVYAEQGFVKPVLSMMREVAKLAKVHRGALWHQVCTSENELLHLREERDADLAKMAKEKDSISKKLCDSEAANNRLKSEMRAETDRMAREKKDLSEQIQDVESQLEWLRSEKDEEIAKLVSEKKVLQDHLVDAETQLSQLNSRKREESKRVMKEKNALMERVKKAEASRIKSDEELKRYAAENVAREEKRKSLENEIRHLTQTVGQTKEEKREKEEQVTRCEVYIDGMESKLQTCQQYIHHLEASLQEEMSRHAPLYGVGLEALSLKELETLSRIHEEGLRQIHAIQQLKLSPASNHHLVTLPHGHTLYSPSPPPPPPPPMAVGIPPSHGNGHMYGSSVGPWFNNH